VALTLKALAAELEVGAPVQELERELGWAVLERAVRPGEQRALAQEVLGLQVPAAAPAPLALRTAQVDLPGGSKEMQSGPAEEKIPPAAKVSGTSRVDVLQDLDRSDAGRQWLRSCCSGRGATTCSV
jgi:hypothetical protein